MQTLREKLVANIQEHDNEVAEKKAQQQRTEQVMKEKEIAKIQKFLDKLKQLLILQIENGHQEPKYSFQLDDPFGYKRSFIEDITHAHTKADNQKLWDEFKKFWEEQGLGVYINHHWDENRSWPVVYVQPNIDDIHPRIG